MLSKLNEVILTEKKQGPQMYAHLLKLLAPDTLKQNLCL